MINLERTQVIWFTWPRDEISSKLQNFFIRRGLPYKNIATINPNASVITRRNKVVQDLILPRREHFDWFLFVDYDHFPIDGQTDAFLEDIDADVVGCQYDTGNNASWLEEDQFHMGFVRIRGAILQQIEPPWFMFEYSEDGTQVTSCECNYLRKKLRAAGAKIVRRGYVGHHNSDPTWVNCT
jgi:hypothetical protein